MEIEIQHTRKKQQEKKAKIYTSNIRTNPRMAHVQIDLSPPNATHNTIRVVALHDSGCAKSVIKTSVFKALQEKGLIEVTKPAQNTVIVTCTGAMEEVTGTADIVLHFKGDNGTKMAFKLNVIIQTMA